MADIWFDVDIALSEVPINLMSLIDDTDFKTREESVVYNQSGLDLLWNFTTTAGAFTQTAVTPTDTGGAHDWVSQGNGYYTIEIPASSGTINNNTEGFGFFSGFATGILPWRGPVCGFRAAVINNALIDDTSLLTSLDIGQLFESAITTVSTQTAYITTVSIVTDDVWIGQTIIVEDVSTGESWVTWVSDVVQSTDTIHLGETPPFTVVANDIVRVESRRHPRFELNDYDPPTRGELSTDTASILAKLLAYVRLMTRSDGFVDIDDSTELTAINASGGSGAGNFDPETDSIEARADLSATLAEQAKIPKSDGSVIWNNTALAAINTEADTALTDAALATAANLATVDTVVDAIKVPTDKMVFTKANELDVNAKSFNGATITGNGDETPWDGE